MSSNIISSTINQAFPVAGVDNDSQGYRDNFSIIKNSLAAAIVEVEDLQDNTAKTDADSNYNGTNIIDANLDAVTQKVFPGGTTTATVDISFAAGHYQRFTVGVATEFNFTNWPVAERLAKVTIHLVGQEVNRNVTFVTENSGSIRKDGDFPAPLTVNSNTEPFIIDAWTFDGGATVYLKYLGQFI